MHVFRALLYLRFLSLRNLLGNRLRRLRQPKYLFGALAGVAYFWLIFFRRGKSGGPSQVFASLGASGNLEVVAAIVLTLFLVFIWVTPGDEPGLAFTEAEVAFLFPAPLARRQLIHYKLLNGLLMSLFGALFFTLLAGGLRQGWIGAGRNLGAWWSLNANLSLQQTLAALTITRLSQAGFHVRLRRTLLIGGASLLVAVIITVAIRTGTASLAWLLWPARLIVAPFLADSPGTWLLALGPAFGLVALQYFWIHRMETPFEEASIVRAQKSGEKLARFRAGKGLRFSGTLKAKNGPFVLGEKLPPEAAFLWKNMMAAPSYLNRKVFLAAAALIIFGFTWLKHRPDIDGPKLAAIGGFITLSFLAYLLIIGPQLARNDLRGDLMNADILKAYPLPGWRILLGSLLAPTVILTGIAWLLLLAAFLGIVPPPGRTLWLTPLVRIVSAAAVVVITPTLCAVQLLVPNAAMLFFPAWSQTSRPSGGGIDVMGQRMIFFAGQFLCLIVALLPAVLVGGGTLFLTQWLIGLPTAIVLSALLVVAIFVGEVWLGVWLLGPRFERLDISAEQRP